MEQIKPCEGDVFDVVAVDDHKFTIRYGYYSEAERETTDPIPIYPCFISDPRYTAEGYPLVTRIQDACDHYDPGQSEEGDGWCADCIHCILVHTGIGVCQCKQNQKESPQEPSIFRPKEAVI